MPDDFAHSWRTGGSGVNGLIKSVRKIAETSQREYLTPGAASRNLYVPYLLDSLTGEALFLEYFPWEKTKQIISPLGSVLKINLSEKRLTPMPTL